MNTEITPTPLTVVGAGPAGIYAAHAAAQAGIAVTLIDENQFPGGQYYRQAPQEIKLPASLEHAEAGSVYSLLNHPNIKVLANQVVWGVFEERLLALADKTSTSTLQVDKLVLAPGAYERPIAFPGWTLPGVMGAGATLRMIKTQGLLPGKRVLLAGMGPLQLPLASLLLGLGVEVVCIAEAARPISGLGVIAPMLENPDRVQEAFSYFSALLKNHTPYLFNHAILRVEGQEQVERAVIAVLDRTGKPIPGTEKSYDVDCVCLGYGFLPLFQVPVAIGCELRYDPALRWYLPWHRENMETSVPGVFVAGDVTDMGGAKVAEVEGRVAGLTAAFQLGAFNEAEYQRLLRPELAKLRRMNRLARAFQKMYAFPEELAFLADDETIICRCEEVTLGKLKQVLELGVENLSQVKRLSRAGMGYCQGRNCSVLVAPYVNRVCGQPLDTINPFTIRPPLHPVPLEVITSGALMDYEQKS
jgi:D-hydroxyproline dehydrogenase subunit alpha